MRSKTPEMTLYKEAHWPQSVSQSLAVGQSLTHESFTTLDLAETSALDCTWHIVPFKDESILVLVVYLSVVKEPGESDFAWTVIIATAAVTLPSATEAGGTTLANWSLI